MTIIEEQKKKIQKVFEASFALRNLEEEYKVLRKARRNSKDKDEVLEIEDRMDACDKEISTLRDEERDLQDELVQKYGISTQFVIRTVR